MYLEGNSKRIDEVKSVKGIGQKVPPPREN